MESLGLVNVLKYSNVKKIYIYFKMLLIKDSFVVKILQILDEEDSRNFWLSWDRGMVQIGEGRRRGLDTFLRWKVPPNKQHSVNCIAVSTGPGSKGTWEFVELIRKFNTIHRSYSG